MAASERVRISPAYLALQQDLHRNPKYGTASLTFAPIVKKIMAQFNVKSISDYGAGKCNLKRGLAENGVTDFVYCPYDPAFPEYGEPQPAELVCCIDVLEHIEPEYLDTVLLDLREVTRVRGFFSVASRPAAKVLADGRNAHLIQEPASWWLPKLCRHFEIEHLEKCPTGFWVLVT